RGLTCVVLEGRSVEQPDRQSADRDDAKKNEREGDVRLPLGIVLSKAVHLPGNPRSCGAEGDRTPDLMSAIHALSQLSYSPDSGSAAIGHAASCERERASTWGRPSPVTGRA